MLSGHLNPYGGNVVDKTARSSISAVNSRIDNIIANGTPTEGNTELIDIRTGSDGRVYQSAGKAVRSQISDIKNTAVICANHRVTDSADEYYDANNVPPGKIIAYGNSGTNIPDLLGTLFCLEGTSANGRTQIYISRTAEILCRVRWNNVWTVWQSVNQTTANNILIANGFVSLGKIYSTTGINSANDILANTIYTIEGPFTISDLPDTLENTGTIMTYSCRYDANAPLNGTVQVYVDKTGKCAVRMKWSYSWTDWKIMPDFAQVESLINTGISNIMTPQNIHNAKGIALMGRLDDTSQIANADLIPANSVYLINNSGISGLPASADVFGTIMTYYDNDSNGPKNGTVQIYIDRTGKFFYRIKWSGNWSAWQYAPKASDISSAISEYGATHLSSNYYCGFSLFENIGVVGDSYASGAYGESSSASSAVDHINKSWPQILARQNGCSVTNYTKGGISTRTFITNSTIGLPALLADTPKELYILALERNDYNIENHGESGYLGAITDITNHSLGSYPDTFYGNYATIIENIMNHAPNAKIVMMSGDYKSSNTLGTSYNQAVQIIADHYGLPCMVQLDEPFFSSDYYRTQWAAGGHPSAIIYSGMETAIERMFNKCVAENKSYFTYI